MQITVPAGTFPCIVCNIDVQYNPGEKITEALVCRKDSHLNNLTTPNKGNRSVNYGACELDNFAICSNCLKDVRNLIENQQQYKQVDFTDSQGIIGCPFDKQRPFIKVEIGQVQ